MSKSQGKETEEQFKQRMRKGWCGGLSAGTVCGNGSTLANTVSVRAALPRLVKTHKIRFLCDAGAGDMKWVSKIEWGECGDMLYLPCDLVPRSELVRKLDITKERLPQCDLILCRMVLNHLTVDGVLKALELFREVSPRLLATQHRRGSNGAKGADYSEWDLSVAPFSLGEPLSSIQEDVHKDCTLSLWRIS